MGPLECDPSYPSYSQEPLHCYGCWAGTQPCDLVLSDKRAELARLLTQACHEIVGLTRENLNLEFTQHDGDEMYHPMLGGMSRDWDPNEAAPGTEGV